MPNQTINYEIAPADEGRADLVVARLTKMSRARVRGLFDHGGVLHNGEVCADAGAPVAAKARLQITFDPERRYRTKRAVTAPRDPRGFSVVFVDQYLVIVD